MTGTVLVSGSPLANAAAELLLQAGCEVRRGEEPPLWSGAPLLPSEQWRRELIDVEAILVTPHDSCPAGMVHAAPRLRGVVSMVIGVDTIAVSAVHDRGLVVANGAAPENFNGLAEATVMLCAALLLDLPGKQAVLSGTASVPPGRMRGRLVAGKTIGLVGLGRSGRAVVERLRGWDVRVLAHDPYVSQASAAPPVEMVELQDLLESSDVVSLHVVLNEGTRHLIGEKELRAMRSDAYLINTSRGPVVEEAALIAALRERQIAGAALDVFEIEPLRSDSPLRSLENVILTPHMIGHSQELMDALPVVARNNVLAVLDGRNPPHLVSSREQVARWHEWLNGGDK